MKILFNFEEKLSLSAFSLENITKSVSTKIRKKLEKGRTPESVHVSVCVFLCIGILV